MSSERPYEEGETPLERAARAEEIRNTVLGHDAQAEHEADVLVADIDAYVAETDPDSRNAADAALNAWEIPVDPREVRQGLESADSGAPLVAVLAVQSESEANIVRGILESEGIPVAFDNLPAPIMGNVFSAADARWGDILVPPSDADRARAIIAADIASGGASAEPPTQP